MEQKKTMNSISMYLLNVAALAFVLLFVVLSYYNRPTYDDFGNIYFAKGNNIFEYVKLFYNTYGGRWVSWAYIYIVFAARDNFLNIPVGVFIYYLLTLIVFIYATKEIIRIGAYKLFFVVLDNKTTVTFSILFIACFYFFTFNNIEAWWYICASFHYLQGIVFLLLGIALLLREQIKTIHYIAIAVSFIYVGSGFELYALIVIAVFFICLVYLYVKHKEISLKSLIVAFLALLISTASSVIAPGNFGRRQYFKENITEYFHPITWHNLSGILLQKKFIIAFLLASVWFVIGMQLKNNYSPSVNKKRIKNCLIVSIITLFLSIIILYLFFALFTYGIMPPYRAWTFTSFAFAFFLCFSFLLIGYFTPFLKQLQNELTFFISICIMLLLFYNLYNQYKYASNYARQYDQLINSFLVAKANNQTAPFYMDKLPDSGMLMQLDMEDQTSNPKYLKKILGVEYEVIVRH